MQVKVNIEEVLSRTIKIEIPDGFEASDREEYVENKIKEMYLKSNGKSILSPNDFKGYVQIQYEDGEVITEWYSPF